MLMGQLLRLSAEIGLVYFFITLQKNNFAKAPKSSGDQGEQKNGLTRNGLVFIRTLLQKKRCWL